MQMGRRPKQYRPGQMVEVTSRTTAGLFSLRPCSESTSRILGVIGRAQARLPSIRLHSLNPLATHFTMLISSLLPRDISRFNQFVFGNISKELRLLHKLPHKVFEARARTLPIAQDAASEESRLHYVLAQGTKEFLVESPREYPGVTGVHALEEGRPLGGWWFDRSALGARRISPYSCATWYPVTLSPLPSWQLLKRDDWRTRVIHIVDDIIVLAAKARSEQGVKALGPEVLMAFSPTHRAPSQKRSPAPICLSATRESFLALKAEIVAFTEAYFASSRRVRRGESNVQFPPYSFPPGCPMVEPPKEPVAIGPPRSIAA